MNRHFYNLEGGGDRFSFAKQMAARGFISILVDLPGIGDSDQPEDGYALTPDCITHILSQVYSRVCEDLHAGRISDDLPALPQLKTIGLGHSFGAMLTVLQQSKTPVHSAIAVLGFATHGLPQYLSAEAVELASDTQAVRAQLVPLARKMFGESYPVITQSQAGDMYAGAKANRDAVQALKQARAPLLPVPALLSMLPNNVAPEVEQIEVPVYVALGELDFVKSPEASHAGFINSPAVERITLSKTGHSFFLFESRVTLFDRLAQWARSLIALN